MNAKELAQILNCREYGREITRAEEELAKKNNLVVVFGYSDDCVELRGAIDEEFDTKNIYINQDGLIKNECNDDDCPYFKKRIESANYIHSEYCGFQEMPHGWMFKFNDPVEHETFDIMKDGEIFCKGIVFNLQDL